MADLVMFEIAWWARAVGPVAHFFLVGGMD